MIEQSLQLGTVPTAPGGLLAENSLAASRLKAEDCAVVSCSFVETRAEPMSMVAERYRQ